MTEAGGLLFMTMKLYPAASRGQTKIDWLESYHSFSFGDFYDPARMGFGALRVLNDDHIAPASGFGMHPHKDMEIVTIMLAGRLEHGDSMGNRGVIAAGEVQRMTAGTGVLHSEMNNSSDTPAHLLQIWVSPDKRGYAPSYEQRTLPAARDGLVVVVHPAGKDGAIVLHQDAYMLLGNLDAGKSVSYSVASGGVGRGVYAFIVDGEVLINGTALGAADALAVSDEMMLRIVASTAARMLLLDIPLHQ